MDKDFLDKILRFRNLIRDVGSVALLIDCEEKIDGQVYDGQDLLNACLVFNHVASNIIISRHLAKGMNTEDAGNNIAEYGNKFRMLIKEYAGLDMHDLASETVEKDD